MDVNLESAPSELKKTSRCFLGQRHIVVIIGFFNTFLIQSNRLVLGVGIAAMEKHKQANETSERISSDFSCPLPSLPAITVAVSNLQGEFDWSAELQGYVLAAGFLGYLITQSPAGWLADSVGSKPLLVFSNCLTGLFVIISPLAARWHVYALMAVQFLRGASQGITNPAIFKMLSHWIPRTERGTLNGISVCGFPVGIAIGGMVTGLLSDIPGLGWPSAFYMWGTVTVLLAIVTHFIYYEHPVINPWITDEELKFITNGLETKVPQKPPPTPWKKIFASVPVYAYFYGLFGDCWGIAYFLTVQPTYMGTMLHFSINEV
ncbi:unnamed protein product [Larinioides sclopetarius]|uniref:Major facilitator superfamily (MFS) profile domain-containing protein n=1 Tax=Larinioides sclopetarius TaxID=280406 RepID=A0AAV1ZGU9_9ARAC